MRTPRPDPTRITSADAWLAVGLAVVAVAASALIPVSSPYRQPDAIGLGIAGFSALVLMWRRPAPVAVVAATGLAVVVNTALGYPVTLVQWPAWISVFTCFSLCGWGLRGIASALTMLSVCGFVVFDRGLIAVSDVFGLIMSFLISAAAGDAARSRRAAAEAAEARALAEARERVMIADKVLTQERRRLAGELHDALGHAVNVIVMQAGVGRRIFAENPQFAAEALAHIETVGRAALDELDRLLRVMDPDGSGGGREPALTDLADLAAHMRAAGRDLQLCHAEVNLSASAERALFRIAQEAVTNALRHTDHGSIRVDISQTADTVLLEVVNQASDLPVPVPGRGLVGMNERARLEGGVLEAGPVDGGFRVRALLPAQRPMAVSS